MINSYMHNKDYKAAMQRLKNAQCQQEGKQWEQYIDEACRVYSSRRIAYIEKTPEPFQIEKEVSKGRFTGHYKSQAQPDYKGTLHGGRCICFDAKATYTDKIDVSRVTKEQIESLKLHSELGAGAFVLCCWSFRRYAMIPIGIFLEAKKYNGHKSWTADEAAKLGFEVFYDKGFINFLKGVNFSNVQQSNYDGKNMQ